MRWLSLIKTQREYIKYLESEVGKYASTSKYQISNEDFRIGQELRDQIEEDTIKLENEIIAKTNK